MSHTLKIRVLIDIEEDVFRDFEIANTTTFEVLHSLILDSFNFEDGQMASFYMSNENWDKGEEITLMDMAFDQESSTLIMSDTPIGDFLHEENQRMVYVYDFLVMWCFFVEVVEVKEGEDGDLPRLVQSFGEAPAQDHKEPDFSMAGMDFSDILDDGSDPVGDAKKGGKDIFDDFDDFEQFEYE